MVPRIASRRSDFIALAFIQVLSSYSRYAALTLDVDGSILYHTLLKRSRYAMAAMNLDPYQCLLLSVPTSE